MKTYHKSTRATWKPVDPQLARKLLKFVTRRNVGKSIEIDGKTYTLDHVSQKTSKFFQSRGFSAYFRVGQSIIRISDHWSKSNGAERSRKLNCYHVDSCWWEIDNKPEHIFEASALGSGRFPYRLIAGRCALRSFQPYLSPRMIDQE